MFVGATFQPWALTLHTLLLFRFNLQRNKTNGKESYIHNEILVILRNARFIFAGRGGVKGMFDRDSILQRGSRTGVHLERWEYIQEYTEHSRH